MKTDDQTLLALQNLHDLYVNEVEASGIKPLSVKIYNSQSLNFVRWVAGDFVPGDKAKQINAKAAE